MILSEGGPEEFYLNINYYIEKIKIENFNET